MGSSESNIAKTWDSKQSDTHIVKSICRICIGACGVEVKVKNGKMIDIRGDHDHPLSKGYACVKGLQAVEQAYGANRLLHPLKRMPDGSFQQITYTQALDEIGVILKRIIERDGPDAIAAYRGTAVVGSSAAHPMIEDWLRSIGSTSFYSTQTIDQLELFMAPERVGFWEAGAQHMYDSEVMMIVGTNPLVSATCLGYVCFNPTKKMHEARERGMKVISIDPRRSETARHADVFLQPYPGEDPIVAAGLIRIILANDWQDKAFCDQHVDQMDELRHAVEHFTPDVVEKRAGVPAADLVAAARMFSAAKTGIAVTGTGPVMAYRGLLTKHLYDALNIICGRFLREGDAIRNPGVLSPRIPARAQVKPPTRHWESLPQSRIRGAGLVFGEKTVGTLADEITTPGKGQIKAFLTFGANPAATIPDREKIVAAFKEIELLVTVDPYMHDTGILSHYVLPPTIPYERPDFLFNRAMERLFVPAPIQQYTPAVVAPPEGSDVMEDWRIFWELAKRLGMRLKFDGVDLDMATPPTSDEILALLTRNGQVSFEEIKAHDGAAIFDIRQTVEAADPETAGRFQIMPPDVAEEMAEIAAEPNEPQHYWRDGKRFSHTLASRRMREVYNTFGPQISRLRKRRPYTPAYLHPTDLEAKGLTVGDRVWIESSRGRIGAIVAADDKVKPGVISMAHGWGRNPGEEEIDDRDGSCTGLLIDDTAFSQKLLAKPRMSGIPVNISKRTA